MKLFLLILTDLCVFVIIQGQVTDVIEETEEPVTNDDENTELDGGPVTEQVMEPNITINKPNKQELAENGDVIDDEATDPTWDINLVIRDLAYFLRAHKFHDYDRRYYKDIEESSTRLYEEFPKPPLRSLHWEVHKNCDIGFHNCLRYLEKIVIMTSLRREDDTVTIMRVNKWNLQNNTQQILAVQKDCQMSQRRDKLTFVPFQGPIERFQWRTSASYYMCWYTMMGQPELEFFDEPCSNHANCLDVYGVDNKDPRANDAKPFACALYSFCPDHCCPFKHIWYMRDCFQNSLNPCYRENQSADRKCTLNREKNQDFHSLIGNHINVTCDCRENGYEWSSRFGLCVDVNECTRDMHDCTLDAGEICINLPGSHTCICSLGLVYSTETKSCVSSPIFERALHPSDEEDEDESKPKVKSILASIVKALTRSSAIKPSESSALIFIYKFISLSLFIRSFSC